MEWQNGGKSCVKKYTYDLPTRFLCIQLRIAHSTFDTFWNTNKKIQFADLCWFDLFKSHLQNFEVLAAKYLLTSFCLFASSVRTTLLNQIRPPSLQWFLRVWRSFWRSTRWSNFSMSFHNERQMVDPVTRAKWLSDAWPPPASMPLHLSRQSPK